MNQSAVVKDEIIQDEGPFPIDKSRVYALNAGQCDRCGQFKTWDFRVPNPKTGKLLPGHINKDGFKINNGDCPYWTAIRNNNKSRGKGKKVASSQPILHHNDSFLQDEPKNHPAIAADTTVRNLFLNTTNGSAGTMSRRNTASIPLFTIIGNNPALPLSIEQRDDGIVVAIGQQALYFTRKQIVDVMHHLLNILG